MSNRLSLQVVLDVFNKASKPLRQVDKDSQTTTKSLRKTRDQLKQLQAQQNDIRGFRRARAELFQQNKALQQYNQVINDNQEQLAGHTEQHEALRSQLKASKTQYEKLSKRLNDGTELTQEFRDELTRSKNALEKQQAAFDRSGRKLQGYKSRISKAQKQVKSLNQAHSRSSHNLNTYKEKLDSAGISTDKLSAKNRKLAQSHTQVADALKQQKQQLEKLHKVEKMRKARKERLDKIRNKGMMIGGHGAVGAFAGQQAMSGMFGMLQPGIAFQEQMSAVQAVTRLNKDDPRFKALKQQADKLGETTSFSSYQVASGQEFLARAGFSPEAINNSMGDVLALAKANRVELGRSADIISNIAGTFKVDPEGQGNIAAVADLLTATATRANVNLEMLGETMKYLGQAEGLNLTMEQSAAMAGLLGNIGIQGSEAGTTLRAMLTRLAAPTGEAKKAIEELGIQVTDSAGNLRSIPAILADINSATKGMGNAQRTGLLKEIFGEEPGSGMAQLIDKQGEEGINKLVNILKNVKGENLRVADIMGDNAAGDIKELNSAWEGISNTLTDTNNGPLRDIIQTLTGMARGANQWMKANPELTATLVKVAAAGALLLTVLGTLGIMLGGTLMLFGGLAKILPSLGRFKAVGGIFKYLAKGALALGRMALPVVLTGLKALAMFLFTTPIGWAILGIGTAALAIYKYWGPISGFFGNLWQQVKNAFSGGIGGVTALLVNWSPFGIIYKGIRAGLAQLGIMLPNSLSELGSQLISGATQKFKTYGSELINGIKSGLTSKLGELKSEITGIAGKASAWFKDALGIRSPSRVFKGHGNDVIAGLTQGLSNNRKALAPVDQLSQQLKQAGAGLTLEPLQNAMAPYADLASTEFKGALRINGPTATKPQPVTAPTLDLSELLTQLQQTAPRLELGTLGNEFNRLVNKAEHWFKLSATQPTGADTTPLPTPAALLKKLSQAGAGLTLGALALPAGAHNGFIDQQAQIQRLDNRPPLQTKAAPQQVDQRIIVGDIHIHAAEGMDEEKLAQLVQRKILQLQERQSATVRSHFSDED